MNTNRWWAADRQFVSTKKTFEVKQKNQTMQWLSKQFLQWVQVKKRDDCFVAVPRQDIVALKISLIASYI